MTKVAEKEATCTEAGSKAYYVCSVCDGIYEDEAGTKATTVADMVIKATGHKWATTYTSNADSHWQKCTNTGCTEVSGKVAHADTNSDCYCDTCNYVVSHVILKETKR